MVASLGRIARRERGAFSKNPVRTADGARLRENAAWIGQRCGESHTRFGEWPPAEAGALAPIVIRMDLRRDSEKPVCATPDHR
jgi:hypothetical protein